MKNITLQIWAFFFDKLAAFLYNFFVIIQVILASRARKPPSGFHNNLWKNFYWLWNSFQLLNIANFNHFLVRIAISSFLQFQGGNFLSNFRFYQPQETRNLPLGFIMITAYFLGEMEGFFSLGGQRTHLRV